MFFIYKCLYKITRNRKWVLKCVDMLMERDEKLVKEFLDDYRG